MSTYHKSSSSKHFDPAQWVSQSEAAEMRGVTRQAIARLVGKRRFTTLSIGGKTLLKRSEVEEFKPKPPGPSPKTKQFKSRKAR
jgi:excisionase family DNA binding protein